MSDSVGRSRIGLPAWDLAGAIAIVLALDLLVIGPDPGMPWLRAAVGVPVLLLVPGYVVVAALYPSVSSSNDGTVPRGRAAEASAEGGTPLTSVERIALSVVMTLVVVAVTGLAAQASPWGIRPLPLAGGLTVVTVLGSIAAAVRRIRTPAPARPPRLRELLPTWSAVAPRASSTYALNVLLVLSVVVAVGAVAVAPGDDGRTGGSTEVALLAANDGGDLVVDALPTTLEPNETETLHLRVDNHAGETMTYSAIVLLEGISGSEDSPSVERTTELDRLEVTVADGDTRTVAFDVTPTTADERRRLTVLVYADDAPESPDRSSAFRVLQLWLDGSESE